MPKGDGRTPEQRFYLSYVVDPIAGCWDWTKGINSKGYAYIWVPDGTWKGRTVQAYKFGYELKYGPVPDGKELDHLCRNTRCVNPDHLEPVTRLENQMRGPTTIAASNSAKTACPRGHLYSGVNANGGRVCRICDNAAVKRWVLKNLEKVRKHAREYAAEHRERRREYAREYYATHKAAPKRRT